MSNEKKINLPWPFIFPLIVFLVVKLGGTALVGWSFWWVLMPIVPVLALVCKSLGWL